MYFYLDIVVSLIYQQIDPELMRPNVHQGRAINESTKLGQDQLQCQILKS